MCLANVAPSPPRTGKRAPAEADAPQALGTSDTFDDESNTGLTIACGCPPEITFRLVTSHAECAHNTLDCCDRLLACWIGKRDNPALDHAVVRFEGELLIRDMMRT